MSSSIPSRPNWDETWLSVARVIARRSLCSRDQVGAVIVNEHNRIVSTGYNGPPQGFSHLNTSCTRWCQRSQTADHWGTDKLASDYSDCPSLHAEANALSVCDRTVREGGTIYVTSAICFGCAKLVANSGLKRVVIAIDDMHDFPHRNAVASYEFLKNCGMQVDFK